MSNSAKTVATFAIKYELGYEELVSALCWPHRENGLDPLPKLSISDIRMQVRNTLRYAGEERYCFWADTLAAEPDEWDQAYALITSWARECVGRAWPHLVPKAARPHPAE